VTTATTLATRDAAMSLMSVTYYRITNSQRVVRCIKSKNKAKRNLVQKYKSLSPPHGKRRARRPNQ
jgi:hypothetical protein